MRILKRGDPQECRFECPNCGCEFIAEKDEFTMEKITGMNIEFGDFTVRIHCACKCPCCGNECRI